MSGLRVRAEKMNFCPVVLKVRRDINGSGGVKMD